MAFSSSPRRSISRSDYVSLIEGACSQLGGHSRKHILGAKRIVDSRLDAAGFGIGDAGSKIRSFVVTETSRGALAQAAMPFRKAGQAVVRPFTSLVMKPFTKGKRRRARQEADEDDDDDDDSDIVGFNLKSFMNKIAEGTKKASPYAKYALPILAPATAAILYKTLKKKPSEAPALAPDDDIDALLASSSGHDLWASRGEESRELAREGSAERSYAFRASGSSSIGSSITNDVFRASVWQRALKLSRGKPPTTKQLFKANASVLRDMRENDIRLNLRGARPSRVTR